MRAPVAIRKVDFPDTWSQLAFMTSLLPFTALTFPSLSPEIFTLPLFGMEFSLRWYALAYIVGIVLGWRLAVRAAKTPRVWPPSGPVMTPKHIEDLLTWIIIGVIVGDEVSDPEYDVVEYHHAGGGTFKVGDFGALLPSTAGKVSFGFELELTDADGDTVATDPIVINLDADETQAESSAASARTH